MSRGLTTDVRNTLCVRNINVTVIIERKSKHCTPVRRAVECNCSAALQIQSPSPAYSKEEKEEFVPSAEIEHTDRHYLPIMFIKTELI